MKRRIFRGRKLDPPIPFGWAAHTRLGFRQLGDNRCDKLPNLMGKSKELAARHFAPWASYQMRKITGCACAGNAGNVFPTAAG